MNIITNNHSLLTIKRIMEYIFRLNVTMMTLSDNGIDKCALMVDACRIRGVIRKLCDGLTIEHIGTYAIIY